MKYPQDYYGICLEPPSIMQLCNEFCDLRIICANFQGQHMVVQIFTLVWCNALQCGVLAGDESGLGRISKRDLWPYILKATQSADFAFSVSKICDKSA